MRVYKHIIFVLSLFLVCCNDQPGKRIPENVLPDSNGGRMDIIVVAKESLWESVAGEIFRKYFTAAQIGLPQPEAVFTVRQVPPESFNSLLQRSRNIVILSEDSTAYIKETNKWAKPQIIYSISAPDQRSLARLIFNKHEEIFETLKEHELDVLRTKMRPGIQKNPEILAKHNVSMEIPKAFELEHEQENLLVFWNKTLKTDQGIIIYFRSMPETMGPVGSDVIHLRDSLTEIYIKGDREGSYMITEDILPPVSSNTEIDGQFTLEVRGLWRTVNAQMGGPFINYTVYDERNQQIIHMDAFVFSPETKKRNFVVELEAILRSLEIGN